MNKLKKVVNAASAGRMDCIENNEAGLSLLSGEAVFHDAHNYEYKMYKVVRGNKTILKTVLTAKKGEWTEAEKAAIDNLDQLLALPKAKGLPEPLKSVVCGQFYFYDRCYYYPDTSPFVLYIESEQWAAEEIEALNSQINKYDLKPWIKMPAKQKDPIDVSEGEPVITVYCGLSGRFNFIE